MSRCKFGVRVDAEVLDSNRAPSLFLSFTLFYLIISLFSGLVTGTIQTKSILCIGDSITRGTGSEDVTLNSYPALLSQSLKQDSAHHYRVTNYGVNSKTVQKNTRISYWDTHEFLIAKKQLNATAVIIGLGTNDAIYSIWNENKYMKDYIELIEVFKEISSNPQIFLLIPPPLFGLYAPTKINATVVNELLPNYVIKSIAAKSGAKVIDVFTPIIAHVRAKHKDDFHKVPTHLYARDGVHPNNNGYRIIADTIKEALDAEKLK